MGWTMLYLFLFLKLPILAAGYIVWWAVRQEPDASGDPEGGGGGRPRPHPRPRWPRPPRRGPHATPDAAVPPRVRLGHGAGDGSAARAPEPRP
jgi:hypothetical protein